MHTHSWRFNPKLQFSEDIFGFGSAKKKKKKKKKNAKVNKTVDG